MATDTPPDHRMPDQKSEGCHQHSRGSKGPCAGITQQYSGYIGRGTGQQAQAQRGPGSISAHGKSHREKGGAHIRCQMGLIGMQPSGREQSPPLSLLTNGRDFNPTCGTKRLRQQPMERDQYQNPGQHCRIPRQGTSRDGGAVPGKAAVLTAIFQNHGPRPVQRIGLDPQ